MAEHSFRKRFKPMKIPPLTAFILIKIEGGLKETIQKLKKIPGLKRAYPVTGEYNVIAKLEAETEDEIRKLVAQIKMIDSIKGTLTLKVQPPLPHVYEDVESRIRGVIGETGIVDPKYDGYEVIVIDESTFPWPAVFKLLLVYQLARSRLWILSITRRSSL
jgi:DNA-binding Lrp family transcriptional regulator